MIIATIILIYVIVTYFIGFKWFVNGGGESWIKYIFFAISPIVVPFYVVLMFLFMGLGHDD